MKFACFGKGNTILKLCFDRAFGYETCVLVTISAI